MSEKKKGREPADIEGEFVFYGDPRFGVDQAADLKAEALTEEPDDDDTGDVDDSDDDDEG